MASVRPFKIEVPQAKIDKLKQKLALSDYAEELEDEDTWVRGPPAADLKRLGEYWKNGFDWRAAEAKLNELPQYTASVEVDGFGTYDVHFVYKESKCKNAVPLVFAHGWPGSFIEVTKMLPLLNEGGQDFPAFHVVAPSLVNFGFSSRCKKKNFTSEQHAEVCHKIMQILGFDQYVAQGGDVGYSIVRLLAHNYPQHCKSYHINMAIPTEPTPTTHPLLYAQAKTTPLTEEEQRGVERGAWFQKENIGYYRIQSTKPQTIGYNITDSPIGLLAWIYDKLHDWTDSYPWTDDEILTWISIYYFSTAGPASSQVLYFESEHEAGQKVRQKVRSYIDVPFGYSRFPKEISVPPKLWMGTLGPMVLMSEHESGGHFAAWERPEAIVKDLRDMMGKGGKCFGLVQGLTGYDDNGEAQQEERSGGNKL